MAISGNLKTMALAELLQWLSQGQKTGTLVIDDGNVVKRIFFRGGTIISSASTDPKEYLGHFLVSHGHLTEEQVNEAVARQEAEKLLLGKILVDMGAIAADDLDSMLQLKAEESIYDLFTWPEGEFEFLDGELPEKTMVPMNLDVQWIVLEGSRRLDEWTRLREIVPSQHVVPVAMVDLQALDIDEVDKRILSWIDDERSIEEISHGSQTGVFQVSQVVAERVKAGEVKAIQPKIIEKIVEKVVERVVEKIIEKEVARPAWDEQGRPPAYPYPYPPQYAQQASPPSYPSGQAVPVAGRQLHYALDSPSGEGGGGQAAPASAPSSEARRLLREAEEHLAAKELDKALRSYRAATKAEGSDDEVARLAKAGESKVQDAVEKAGFTTGAVPRLKCRMDELTQLDISPQEGFMLTRIDGSYDIGSLLKLSPMPRVEAQVFFWRLRNSGHLSL